MTGPIDRPTSDTSPTPPAGPAPISQPDVAAPPPGSNLPAQAARPRRGRLDLLLALAAVVAIGGVAFAAGRVTAPATSRGGFPGGFTSNGQIGQGVNPNGGTGALQGNRLGGAAAIKGEVVEITADHLTLKLASGQTVQIALATTTAFHQQAAATAADVATGRQVLVQLAARTPMPDQSPGTPGQGGSGFTLGAATDVTVVQP